MKLHILAFLTVLSSLPPLCLSSCNWLAPQPQKTTPTPQTTSTYNKESIDVKKHTSVHKEPSSDTTPMAKPHHTISGVIEEISLQNINKRRGHYTFNVRLKIRHTEIVASDDTPPKTHPEVVIVHVDKLYWSALDDSTKHKIAPNGPKSSLSPSQWNTYTKGATITLKARFTGPALAFIIKP